LSIPNCYKNFLVYSGPRYSVYFHAEANNSSEVYSYFKNCGDVTQASLLHLAKVMGEEGRIYDETRFRNEDKKNKIYCFKPKQERFFCFFLAGRKIVISSAYTKKQQKLDRKELKKAVQIRKQYIN